MSTLYKSSKDVPAEVLVARLDQLADVVSSKRERIDAEFTMRIPAEVDRDADLVMSEAAVRLEALQAECESLRAKTSLSLGVGDGTGNLFVHGDYDSIKRVQALIFECEKLRKDAERHQYLLEAVLCEIPHRKGGRGNAPGHAHSVPGIWDDDNGALAGKECAWCKVWNEAVSAMQELNK